MNNAACIHAQIDADRRARFVAHILSWRRMDEDEARRMLVRYDTNMPWLGLKEAVREALK
jgi:hypothetical protein